MSTAPVSALQFTIAFHGPFHVGGSAQEGLDRRLDPEFLLPGSSLKGLMRAEARERLGINEELVTATFGAPGGRPSPWWWSGAEFDNRPALGRFARIRRTEAGVTDRGFLLMGESVWATTARFVIEPVAPEATAGQRRLLRAAAASVTALGGARQRGEGFVSITDAEGTAWSDEDLEALIALGRSR